ncbi:MAG: cyclic nucleotide-binding domain-containing protein [bacterium]|nr:cyclic nucleotide-binding domain-containing protein [bacterium]
MTLVDTLRQADIFVDLTNTQLELLASICTEQSYAAGAVIFEENTPGTELYVIADGEVEIQIDPSILGTGEAGGIQTIAILRRGQSFGEVALVDEGLRSARARSGAENTRVLSLPRERLMVLCDSYPQLGYRLMRNLAADLAMKIRNTDLQMREYLTWIRRS